MAIKKNYFFNLLLSLSNILFPIISFPYVSKILGPGGVGKVQFVTSYASYFGLIAALGIPVYGVREIARQRHDQEKLNRTFSELWIIYFVTSLILTLIYVISILVFGKFKQDTAMYWWSMLLIVLSFTSIDWFYEGLEQFKIVAIRSMVVRLFSLGMMFVLIRNPRDYFWYLIIIVFTSLTNNAINMLRLHKTISLRFKGLDFKRHMRPLFLIFSTTIATSMYTMLDTVLLGFLADTRSVGLYTAAVKLSKIAIPIIISLGMVLGPGLAKDLYTKNMIAVKATLAKSFAFTTFLSIPISVGLAVLAPELISVFSSAKFLDATLSMQVLAILPVIIGFGYFFGYQILVPDGKDKQMFISVIGGVIISLGLNFLLVPRFKHLGASAANVLSEIAVTVIMAYYVKKYYDFKFPVKPVIAAIISSLIFIPTVLLVREAVANVYIRLLLAAPVCFFAYMLLQKYLFKEQLIHNTLEPFVMGKISAMRKRFFSFKAAYNG